MSRGVEGYTERKGEHSIRTIGMRQRMPCLTGNENAHLTMCQREREARVLTVVERTASGCT